MFACWAIEAILERIRGLCQHGLHGLHWRAGKGGPGPGVLYEIESQLPNEAIGHGAAATSTVPGPPLPELVLACLCCAARNKGNDGHRWPPTVTIGWTLLGWQLKRNVADSNLMKRYTIAGVPCPLCTSGRLLDAVNVSVLRRSVPGPGASGGPKENSSP